MNKAYLSSVAKRPTCRYANRSLQPEKNKTMLDWINQRFNINLQSEDLESIRDFSLMWNLYEKMTCNSNYNLQRITNFVNNRNFQIQDFQEFIGYFRNRYVENGQLNGRYPHLHLRNSDNPQMVEDVLLERNTNTNDIIVVCSTIIYRFRNNLFHGIKDVARINHQRINFEAANSFMRRLLEIAFP